MSSSFIAIDFETANNSRKSACAVGLVRVVNGRVCKRVTHLIRPPSRIFVYTGIHGISWKDVAGERDFGQLWPSIVPLFDRVDFIAAHNAGFDRGVLQALCDWYGLEMPEPEFVCTVQLARQRWGIRPTRLPVVAEALGIALRHHDAGSDAEACARIVLAARRRP